MYYNSFSFVNFDFSVREELIPRSYYIANLK